MRAGGAGAGAAGRGRGRQRALVPAAEPPRRAPLRGGAAAVGGGAAGARRDGAVGAAIGTKAAAGTRHRGPADRRRRRDQARADGRHRTTPTRRPPRHQAGCGPGAAQAPARGGRGRDSPPRRPPSRSRRDRARRATRSWPSPYRSPRAIGVDGTERRAGRPAPTRRIRAWARTDGTSNRTTRGVHRRRHRPRELLRRGRRRRVQDAACPHRRHPSPHARTGRPSRLSAVAQAQAEAREARGSGQARSEEDARSRSTSLGQAGR